MLLLREDLFELENRVNKLRSKAKDLGTEQGEANRQSMENFGHNYACQEAIYQARARGNTIAVERFDFDA
jgi:hypothetical protein